MTMSHHDQSAAPEMAETPTDHTETRAAALPTSEVEAAIRAIQPLFASDGWPVQLLGVEGHFLLIRLGDGRCQGAVPWVLQKVERELMARLPEIRGVILAS